MDFRAGGRQAAELWALSSGKEDVLSSDPCSPSKT